MLQGVIFLIVLVSIFLNRLKLPRVIILSVLFISPWCLRAQNIAAPIVLNNEKLSFLPKEFFVTAVVDERDDRSAVAWLLPPGGGTPYKVDLKNGVQLAVKQFVDHAVPSNKLLRPVVIRIKRLKLTESQQPGGHIEGKIEEWLSFDLKQPYSNVHLVDYRTSATYTRTAAQQYDTEALIRHTLQAGLTYFNTWINREADTNIKLAKGVKLIFTDYTEQPEGDTIYYDVNRPLRWDDFKAAPIGGKYEASVLPSIGYNERVEVLQGMVIVNLAIKVFLPKSASWVRNGSGNAYSLNHEQRHFDIVKLIAERFKKKLIAEKLPVDNYDGYINVDYLEAFHEMNVMQDQYDNETGHGMNQYMQQQWNEKIDKELGYKR